MIDKCKIDLAVTAYLAWNECLPGAPGYVMYNTVYDAYRTAVDALDREELYRFRDAVVRHPNLWAADASIK